MHDSDSPALNNSSGRRMRVFETACLVTAVGLMVVHAVRFVQAPGLPSWTVLLAVALGLPAADFLSGFVHWAGDTWGRVTTRWIGPRLGWRRGAPPQPSVRRCRTGPPPGHTSAGQGPVAGL